MHRRCALKDFLNGLIEGVANPGVQVGLLSRVVVAICATDGRFGLPANGEIEVDILDIGNWRPTCARDARI